MPGEAGSQVRAWGLPGTGEPVGFSLVSPEGIDDGNLALSSGEAVDKGSPFRGLDVEGSIDLSDLEGAVLAVSLMGGDADDILAILASDNNEGRVEEWPSDLRFGD